MIAFYVTLRTIDFFVTEGIDTGTLAGFGPAAMMANDNDLIRSSPIPA
jgi:hypothetical protein